MTVFDARQLDRQWLASCAVALALRHRAVLRIVLWSQFGQDRRQVGIDSLFKQFALLAAERFALVAEPDTAVVRQFQRQGRNLEVLPCQPGIVLRKKVLCFLGLLDQCPHLLDHGRIVLGAGQFGEQIHAAMLTERSDVYNCQCAGGSAVKRCQSTPAISHCHWASVSAQLVSPACGQTFAEHVGGAVTRCTPKRLLHMQRQPIYADAHVHRLRGQPNRFGLQLHARLRSSSATHIVGSSGGSVTVQPLGLRRLTAGATLTSCLWSEMLTWSSWCNSRLN
jgi:hypothetical protein